MVLEKKSGQLFRSFQNFMMVHQYNSVKKWPENEGSEEHDLKHIWPTESAIGTQQIISLGFWVIQNFWKFTVTPILDSCFIRIKIKLDITKLVLVKQFYISIVPWRVACHQAYQALLISHMSRPVLIRKHGKNSGLENWKPSFSLDSNSF